jgi:ABC-type lipoprotein release transport system permease subunit
MFRTNRSRTFLTILGISIGIGAILFLVSLGYGLQELILNKITTSDALLSLDVSTGDLEKLRLNKESVKKIKEIQGIDKISPVISTQSQITIDNIFSELVVNFVDREFFKLDGTILKNGEFYEDDNSSKDKIIISSAALKLFNLDEKNCYNKQIYFTFFKEQDDKNETFTRDFIKIDRAFKIIGIIEEENLNYVYMPFFISNELDEMDYSKIKIKVDKKESLNLVRDKIIEQGFIVSALSDIIEQANEIFRVVQIVLAAFGIVALAVSAI